MGDNTQSVVDDRWHVHGLERLWVVDGSIMPTMMSGNTHLPVVRFAEKGADIILRDAVARA